MTRGASATRWSGPPPARRRGTTSPRSPASAPNAPPSTCTTPTWSNGPGTKPTPGTERIRSRGPPRSTAARAIQVPTRGRVKTRSRCLGHRASPISRCRMSGRLRSGAWRVRARQQPGATVTTSNPSAAELSRGPPGMSILCRHQNDAYIAIFGGGQHPAAADPTTPGATAGGLDDVSSAGFDRHDLRSGSRRLRPADPHRDDPGHPQHARTQPHRGGHRTDPVPTRRHRRLRRRPPRRNHRQEAAPHRRPARLVRQPLDGPLTGCPGWRAGCGCCREREREACHQPGGQCLTGNTGVLGLCGPHS